MAIIRVMSRIVSFARGVTVSFKLNSLTGFDLIGSDNDFFRDGCPGFGQVDLNRGKTESEGCNKQNCQTNFGSTDRGKKPHTLLLKVLSPVVQ